ncbi:helix-turn-helix domain-containing protein [Hydrogenispora ethanolica]|uniref:helix-turn-helix domain-containing protein n=1 Tax=Hydrogenispora ethanolica TaxID=1082276 RepID=UPI00104FF1DF|nr:helix-turn-helix transcriptional regulator [Hydrogenispora ethanolica]
MDVIARIIELRDVKGYSTNKLAVLSDLTQSTLQSILSGRNQPSIVTLEKICNALDVSLSEFFSTEKSEFDPELRRLLNIAAKLSPNQRHQLQIFLETMIND